MAELRGPLLVVRGVSGVGWDEFATIRARRPGPRRGTGWCSRPTATSPSSQVLEGTGGHGAVRRPRVAFAGSPLRIPVGAGWLGRVCNGRGEPVDGGPPVTGEVTRAA